MKSWALLDLSPSYRGGINSWLDTFPVRQSQSVLFIDEEMSELASASTREAP